MKNAAAVMFLSIALFAYVLVSQMPEPEGELPVTDVREPASPPAATKRSVQAASRAAHAVRETRAPADALAATPTPGFDERELAERLWIAFNSEVDEQAKPVEHEHIVQVIRADPELARELAKDAAP